LVCGQQIVVDRLPELRRVAHRLSAHGTLEVPSRQALLEARIVDGVAALEEDAGNAGIEHVLEANGAAASQDLLHALVLSLRRVHAGVTLFTMKEIFRRPNSAEAAGIAVENVSFIVEQIADLAEVLGELNSTI